MENQLYAYIAGLVDGEGSILLQRNNKSDKFRHPAVAVSNTNYNLIECLLTHFGGRVKKFKKQKDYYKQGYQWTLQGDKAINFIKKNRTLYARI